MKFNKNDLENYSKPLSDTEKERCKHAINMVKDALVEAGYMLTKTLSTYKEDLMKNIAEIYSYKESNSIKKLCPTYEEYKKYVEFVKDLSEFFEYNYTE